MSDDEYDGTVTTAEAAVLVGVKPATIRSWVTRGMLEPKHTWRRSNVFAIADVWAAEAKAWKRDTTGRTRTR